VGGLDDSGTNGEMKVGDSAAHPPDFVDRAGCFWAGSRTGDTCRGTGRAAQWLGALDRVKVCEDDWRPLKPVMETPLGTDALAPKPIIATR